MGTRGLLGFIIRGRKRGIYNHLDSYPEILGHNIVEFILSLNVEELTLMISRLDQITWVNPQDPVPKDIATEYLSKHYEEPLHTRQNREYYTSIGHTHRLKYTGYDHIDDPPEIYNWNQILLGLMIQINALFRPILEGDLDHLPENTEFEADTLFCEWVYWIDFEKRTLVVDDRGRAWQWGFGEMRSGMFRERGTLEGNMIAGGS